MARYHTNPNTGATGACKARINCPFGDMEEDHYSTPGEARAAYEAKMESDELSSLDSSVAQALRPIAAQPFVGGINARLNQDHVAASSHEAWGQAAEKLGLEAKAKLAVYEELKKTRTHGDKELEAARVSLNTTAVRAAFAEKAKELTADRVIGGVKVPPGYDLVPAVYDLEGNLLGPAKDTRTSPQVFQAKNGEEVKYRTSQAKDPEKRREAEASKGFYTGTALSPVTLTYDSYYGLRTKASYSRVRANPELAIPVENGK